MSDKKTFFRNISWGWLSYAHNILVVLVTTPLIIKSIGVEAYGLWLVIQSFVGYYGFIDMGLRAALTQVVTKRVAEQKLDEVVQFIGSAVPILFRLGLVVVAISIVIALILPSFVVMSVSLSKNLWLILLIQGLIVMINLITQPFNGVTVGFQRYDIAEFLGIVMRTIWAIVIAIALSINGSILTFAVASLIMSLFESFVRIQRAIYLLPPLSKIKFTTRAEDVVYLRSKGTWNFLIQIARQILTMTNPLIVGVLFSANAVVPFALASSLIDYGTKLIYQPTRMLFPTLVHMSASGRRNDLKLFFFDSARLFTAIAIAYGISAYIWCDIFFKIWLGSSVANPSFLLSTPWIVGVLSIRFVVVTFLETGIQLLLASEEIKFLAIISMAEALPSLFFAIVFGTFFGPIGVASGSLIPLTTLFVFWYLPKVLSCLEISFFELFGKVCLPLILFAIAFFGCLRVYAYCIVSPESMLGFLWFCGVPSVLIFTSLLVLVFDVRRVVVYLRRRLASI